MKAISSSSDSFNLRYEFSYALTDICNRLNVIRKKSLTSMRVKKLKTMLRSSSKVIEDMENLLFPDKSNAKSKAKSETKTACPPMSILLVEDEPVIQVVHTHYLTEMGFTVECAENGTKALKLFDKCNYALVLLDIGLPDINGIEVCRRMRANKKNIRIPIIAITAESPAITTECLSAGMNDVAFKPMTRNGLRNLLKKHIQLPL
jgi:CheY-like chemotaxis protein